MSETTTTEVNVVTLSNGRNQASIRITKRGDSITAELSMSIAWKPIGGLKAAFNQQAKLEAEGYKVVAAA